jgi:hypothetical protein
MILFGDLKMYVHHQITKLIIHQIKINNGQSK